MGTSPSVCPIPEKRSSLRGAGVGHANLLHVIQIRER